MIEDLTNLYNSSSLPAQNHSGKASKQAVAALLAKVYLAAGWDIDTSLGNAIDGSYNVNSTSNFSQAASWAEKAINGISLTMSFEDKWSPFNEGNEEEIFSIQYERNGYPGDIIDGGHAMSGAFGGYYGAYDASGIKGSSSEDCQSQKSMYLFEKGDTRYAATYMMVMYNATKDASNIPAWGTEGYYAYYNYDRMVMFKDEYLYRVNNNDATNLADYASYPTSSIYSLYNSYNRNFQLMVIIAAGIYALNLVDAYVFGHLYDFRIDDDLTLAVSPGLQPTLAGWQPTVGLTLSF
jgi:hypothetical protein